MICRKRRVMKEIMKEKTRGGENIGTVMPFPISSVGPS
jgi:hypothetical protein